MENMGYPDSPYASGISGLTSGILQGMQIAEHRKQLQQRVMEQRFNTGLQKLQLAKELSAQYKDNPELHATMVAPLWQQGMAGVTGDDKYLQMKYEYHPQDTKFFKHIAEAAEASYHSPEPRKLFDQLSQQIMQRWEQATTPEDRAALKEAHGMLKEQAGVAADKFGAHYRELTGIQEGDPAYQGKEAQQGINEYKQQYLLPTITSLDTKQGAELYKEEAAKRKEAKAQGVGLSLDAISGMADAVAAGADVEKMGFGSAAQKDREAVFNKAFEGYGKEKREAEAKGIPFNRDRALKRAEYKGLQTSLQNQQKIMGQVGSFSKNLNMQIDRLDKKLNEISRTDTRLLNVPIREALMRVKGSAKESILTMYLTDISNDVAKLSTGSSASVAELSQAAQERWAKIHDPNLSLKDLRELLEETRKAGNMRIESTQSEIDATKDKIRGLGGKKKDSGATDMSNLTAQTKSRLAAFRKANPGASDEELIKAIKAKYGDK